MLIWVFRAIFITIIVSVLFTYANDETLVRDEHSTSWWTIIVICGAGMGIFVSLMEILTPKSKLSAFAGVFFGLLVGFVISLILAPIVDVTMSAWRSEPPEQAISAVQTLLGICMCYLTITVVMRTKDDVRFVIPYVEFAKQTKGARPLVLDTSAIVDGRISDLCRSKLFDAPVVVPRFVLNELQLIADSADKLKRNRGRRGLDILNTMQTHEAIDIEIDDSVIAEVEELAGVDQKLVAFSKIANGRLCTTDYNLSKVARVRAVDVINVNDLASMLKVIALPGENMVVKIIKPGEESDQGIGYLDDGTMIVVEGARNKLGQEISISITSSLQTSAGKMIFGKFESMIQTHNSNSHNPGRRRPADNRQRRSSNRGPQNPS
jgi:uncharacterized protein YacL